MVVIMLGLGVQLFGGVQKIAKAKLLGVRCLQSLHYQGNSFELVD